MDNWRERLMLFFKGMAMGGADVVPGVSGGTIAFITGIYDELITSLKAFDIKALQLLRHGELLPLWKKVNGNFLAVLFSGILISIVSLAKFIIFALENYPIQIWSFFFGLIVISAILVLREVRRWNWLVPVVVFLGIIVAYLITSMAPKSTPDNLFFVFASGMVAICAMILPGISGSFILLILGKYESIIRAIQERDFVTLVVFAGGCATGLLSFVRLLSVILNKYRNLTIAILSGFMIGSLNKVWPWKLALTFRLNRHGEQVPLMERSVMPAEYLRVTGEDPRLFEALLFAALGIFLVVIIEKIAHQNNSVSRNG